MLTVLDVIVDCCRRSSVNFLHFVVLAKFQGPLAGHKEPLCLNVYLAIDWSFQTASLRVALLFTLVLAISQHIFDSQD